MRGSGAGGRVNEWAFCELGGWVKEGVGFL